MAYFLKKTKNKKGTYLQIYSSFYDPDRGHTAHRSFKALGYVEDLMNKGIDDPVDYYSREVKKLNLERRRALDKEKARQISDASPVRYLGYFPIRNINDGLNIEGHIRLLQLQYDMQFDAFSVLSSLVYARIVAPASKYRTFYDVLPCMYEDMNFSLDQLYRAVEFFGAEYQKIVEIYTASVKQKYSYDTSHTYFDCTNFYFEIDREDALRRKGPSKENRRDPIVGLGLLLDAHQIPIGMEIYPGNESEKPVLRNVIDELKTRHNISGRTIQVADKGLNCSANIVHAVSNSDGYIFSKSVKQLPEKETTWVFLDNGWQEVLDTSGNLLYKYKECVDEFPYTVTDSLGKKKTVTLKEKRILTYNPKLAEKKIFEINRQVEKARKLGAATAKRSEYGDSAKYVIFKSTDDEGRKTENRIKTDLNEKAIEEDKRLAGYNLLVTSETQMSATEIYEAYHNLWRIEESFRIMKSELDARPVYLQKEDSIKGHFLICYLAVLLLRIFQFKVLEDQYCSQNIIDFIKSFQVIELSENQYVNVTRKSRFIEEFRDITSLPLTKYHLKKSDIKKMLNYRFPTTSK
jgi:transposase